MKKISILLSCIVLSFGLYAQQWLEFSQQNHYKLFLNPALAGAENQIYATLAHRSQYTFLSPQQIASQYGEFSMPIVKKNYGLGLRLINDFIGYQRYTLAEINTAYHLDIGKSVFSFGVGIGLLNLGINGSRLRASGGNYENELVIHNDEHIPNVNVANSAPSFSFGLNYQIQNFKIGIAVQNVNSPEVRLTKTNIETKINIDRTINTYASCVIKINKVKLMPQLNYNTDLIKHQIQLSVLSEINNIYFGVAFRGYTGQNNDALIGLLGIKIKDKIRIGYSYDYNVSFLNQANFGSHEISISYYMKQKNKNKINGNTIYSPRFL